MKRYDDALVWFRRDLRSFDHAALYHALKQARRVHCVFVFDTEILDRLADRADRRVEFIWHSVVELRQALLDMGGGLHVIHGRARDLVPQLARQLGVQAIFCNGDYEPQAQERDAAVAASIALEGRALHAYKDQVIFEKDEVRTRDGRPFTVFTPYKRAWLAELRPFHTQGYAVERYRDALVRHEGSMPSLADLDFKPTNLRQIRLPTGMSGAAELFRDFLGRIDGYRDQRDYPGVRGVSYLSVHLRFGTISIRELVRAAASIHSQGAETWLAELIWREFYFAILHHFPHVAIRAFKPEYDAIRFPDRDDYFAAWCEARTGYPLVDAAMRQLNSSGYMHNRLRMVAASFLVKHLHLHWRRGEHYFAAKLNDFDLAANNGGWQWCASSGCDAQPYFRIFNPVTQSQRFDPEGRFIRLYLPELAAVDPRHIHEPWKMSPTEERAAGVEIGRDYPAPIVDHGAARSRTLELYAAVKKSSPAP